MNRIVDTQQLVNPLLQGSEHTMSDDGEYFAKHVWFLIMLLGSHNVYMLLVKMDTLSSKFCAKHNAHMYIPTETNTHTQYLHKIVHARPHRASPHGRHYSKWALNEIGHTNGVHQ